MKTKTKFSWSRFFAIKSAPSLALFVALSLVFSLSAPQLLQARYVPKPAWNMFPVDQELQVGKQAAADTERKLPVLRASDPISIYVARLGQEIASHAPGPRYDYTYKVINQKDVNAFALPGGPVYINLGTIQAADNESELAGVLAHETSHVVMRHATAAASKQMVAQAGLGILGGLLGRGMGAQLAAMGISFGAGSYFLKNSRNAETQADLVGADIMYDTGFNPQGMVDFFKKLEAQGGAKGSQFFSDHPNPGNRAATVAREVSTLPAKRYRQDSAEFRTIKREAAGMRPLTAQQIASGQRPSGPNDQTSQYPNQGQISRPDVYPSRTYKQLNHNAFRISYPDNWQVFGDTQSTVTIAPQAGVSDNSISYGVVISGFEAEEGPSAGLDRATHELLASLHQSNPDMRQVGHDEDIRVNGVAGKSVDLIGTSSITDNRGTTARERDWLVTMQNRDGTLLYLIFISPDQDFSVLRPTFEYMLRTLQVQ